MSVVVLAYHQMGYRALQVLLRRRIEVSALFTHNDDPQENIWFDSVAALARSSGIPVFTPTKIDSDEWVNRIRGMAPDVLFSFYYRNIINKNLRAVPRFGCVNLHGSLLPKYRGRSPVNWQLVKGEKISGVTLHYMTGRADAGHIIGQESVAIGPNDTALDLYNNLLPAAEKLLLHHLDGIITGLAPRIPQNEEDATKFGGRRPEDGRIDWNMSALEIHNLIRAVAPPWPGAFTELNDGRLMIFRSEAIDDFHLYPGEVKVRDGCVFIGAGEGGLRLLDYSTPGARILVSGEKVLSISVSSKGETL